MQTRLRPFFDDFHQLALREFYNARSWQANIGVFLSRNFKIGKAGTFEPLANYFAYNAMRAEDLDNYDCDGDVCSSVLRDVDFEALLEHIGIYDCPKLKQDGALIDCVSSVDAIGWAAYNRSLGFARHLIFEIGDSNHHIRVDIRNSFNGDIFGAQIDQIILWDEINQYKIPCREDLPWITCIEELIGMVDVVVQALSNGDDGIAAQSFKQIEAIKKEDILQLVAPRPWQSNIVTEQHPF